MKIQMLIFIVAFSLGFALMKVTSTSIAVKKVDQTTSTVRATSSREDFVDSEYEDLMLSNEEKLQKSLSQANTLSALLGLAEKQLEIESFGNKSLNLVAQKMAKLYPAESLDYYATRPTDATMNAYMENAIFEIWSEHDLISSLAYLDHDSFSTMKEFGESWCHFVNRHSSGKWSDAVLAFKLLSSAKQNAIVAELSETDELLSLLLRELKDLDLQRKLELAVQTVMKNKAVDDARSMDVRQNKTAAELEKENREAEIEQLKAGKIVGEDPDTWLKRVSDAIALGAELPDMPGYLIGKGDDRFAKALETWLPLQSPRVQRAWADEMIQNLPKKEALEWAKTLGTVALRSDTRESILSTWVTSEPQNAADYIIREASQEDMMQFLPEATYRWGLQDFAAAKKWLESQADSTAKDASLKRLTGGK